MRELLILLLLPPEPYTVPRLLGPHWQQNNSSLKDPADFTLTPTKLETRMLPRKTQRNLHGACF